MAFKESLKKEIRKKSDGRCVLCHKPFVEIHHIIPQAENGPDTFDNGVALCAYCHDLIGNNPSKRKQLKEIRDSWYEIVEAQKNTKVVEKQSIYEKIKFLPIAKPNKEKSIAVYHIVYKNENFNDAAHATIDLTRECTKNFKNKKRKLFLDIEGHRLKDGTFDHDMWELQFQFIAKNLLFYYSEIHMPSVTIQNPYEQIEEAIPDNFIICEENEMPKNLQGCLFEIVTN